MISQAIVGSALKVPKMSDKLAREELRSHLSGETGLVDILERDHRIVQEIGLVKPIDPTKPGDPAKTIKLIAEGIAKQTVVNVEMVIAAAVVVLSHSTADDVFTTALQLAIDLDPNGWLSEINLDDRKVSLKQMHEKGVEGVLANALASFRNQLGRKESLPSRADLLFRHIKIMHNSNLDAEDPGRFKMTLLKDADELRVRIVHGTGLPKIEIDQAESTMLFLHEAATTAMRSVGGAFQLPLDMEYIKQLATGSPST
jgi:hypothetical protein